MPAITVNGASIYYERQGTGTPLLFIHGALGDASRFAGFGQRFADAFTVVAYDRRGHSRSPRPDGWKPTGIDEQADDAAALLSALSLAPANVYGSSGGAVIALNLVMRHPEMVRRVILHEPPLFSALQHPETVQAEMGGVIQHGMEAGGQPAAAEAFIRWVAGDASREALSPEQRERTRSNFATFAEEAGASPYRPDGDALAAVRVPVLVMASTESMPWFAEAAGWVATKLGVELVRTPGSHTPQRDHPDELAASIRSFLSP